MRTPALDFCRKVQVWQEDEARRAAGLVVVMPDRESDSLSALLASSVSQGGTPGLENRARTWLVGYRELEDRQRILTGKQRTELHAITDQIRAGNGPARTWPARQRQISPRLAILVIALVIALGAGLSVASLLIGSSSGSPPPAGPVAQVPQQPAQGPLTDLQQFRADWNVPSAAVASAGEDQTHVILLQDGLYYPTPWIVLPGDPGWRADSSGGITATTQDGSVTVTDSDGTTWTVFAGRPFVLASNPQVMYRVLHDGTIQSMPEPHAIAVRRRS